MRDIKFAKRQQYYRVKDAYQRGLPVTIDRVKFPDAREIMEELWHWYNYNENPKVIIAGMSKEQEEKLLHLGAFFHPSGTYRNVVTAGARPPLVEIIDAISSHLYGTPFVSIRPLFEGRDWMNPPL